MHLDAVEHQDKIVFLHQVQEGPASQSYGLQVAALAGVPNEVIQTAKQRLQQLETQTIDAKSQSLRESDQAYQFDLFQSANNAKLEELEKLESTLQNLDLNNMTAKQALDWLYNLQSNLTN